MAESGLYMVVPLFGFFGHHRHIEPYDSMNLKLPCSTAHFVFNFIFGLQQLICTMLKYMSYRFAYFIISIIFSCRAL